MDTQTPNIEELVRLLNLVDPTKPLGSPLHSAVVRLSPAVVVEAVTLRRMGENIEVLLRKRGDQEPSYRGQWHCPGSFVRHGEDIGDVLNRLTRTESLGTVLGATIVDAYCWPEERGWICSNIYLVRVINPPDGAVWHPINNLPQPMVTYHQEQIIPRALEAFRRIEQGE